MIEFFASILIAFANLDDSAATISVVKYPTTELKSTSRPMLKTESASVVDQNKLSAVAFRRPGRYLYSANILTISRSFRAFLVHKSLTSRLHGP